jgi:cyclic pyranopterin phosphate synthase
LTDNAEMHRNLIENEQPVGRTDDCSNTSQLQASSVSTRPLNSSHRLQFVRHCSSSTAPLLTHVNAQSGKSEMVDVSDKQITKRVAVAEAKVILGSKVFGMVRENQMRKGDVLGVAKIAGIQAAKLTSSLIPLCHTLSLDQVQVDIELNEPDHSAIVRATTIVHHRTGVEMEALTAACVASLTIYDMCKAASKHIQITQVRLIKKSGGKSDWNEQKQVN